MLAAAEGHIPVMKILLDNHAVVNDGDKMKVRTASCFTPPALFLGFFALQFYLQFLFVQFLSGFL